MFKRERARGARGSALELALQTTLLGLAIAIILALLAALVGPLLIDWGGHRSLFEAEASRLIGVDVRVSGEIEARLLPSPRLTLHDIEIGSAGEDNIRARSLGIEFALGPLMRGAWRASEVTLAGPQIGLGLDASGHVQAPNLAVAFNPDGLTIDRLSIEDGKLILADAANGASVTLERLWFNGEARSLIGPFKGEGAFTIAGELYPFRISAGRYGEDGALKLHVNVDPVNRPLSVEADGALALAGGEPRFDGSLSLARPVGIAARGAAQLTQPWRVSGRIKASAASALMDNVEFQYGSEDEGFKLTGVADFKFGKRPRFDGVLSGRQIDLDRALALSAGSRPLPAAAIRELAELGGGAFRPAIPIQIGVGIDQITLGGNTVANLRGDISTDAQGWNLDRFEFRAPGFTQVRLSGHLAVGATGAAFTGPAAIEASDPKALAAWLEGRNETTPGEARPLSLRGEVTLASDKVAVERLKAEFDRKTIAGRLAYVFASGNRPAKLDAELNAAELDIDAALGFGNALLAGSNIERPRDMTIAADIGRATIAGIEARNASARLKVDAGGLQIDRLSVADLGGGAFSASGRIDTGGRAPRGALALDFETRQTAAIAAMVTKFAPKATSPVMRLLDRVSHTKLHATLDVADAKANAATVAQLAITGDFDAMRLDARVRMTGDWANPSAADVRVDGSIDAADGARLIKLMGLDRIVATGKGPGQFKLLATGPVDGELTVDTRLTADGLLAQSTARGRISFDRGVRMTGSLQVPLADLRPLLAAGVTGTAERLPSSMASRIAIDDRRMTFDDIDAKLGGSTVRGRLVIAGVSPRRIDGALEADAIDAAALIARAIGMPAPVANNNNAAWVWSSEPFADGAFGEFAGQVALKSRRLDVLPRLTVREFRATLRLGKDEFTFDDMAGDVAGGRLAGRISFRTAADGMTAGGKVTLTGADATTLLPAAARPPVTGSLGLSAEVEGTGLSPVALIGSLQGSGKIALADAQFAGLDPRTFDAVTRAVDQGLAIDAVRISDVVSKALESGQLSVKRAEGTIAVSAGQVRLSNVTAGGKDAVLSFAGNVDLTDGSIDARLVLSGSSQAAGARPNIFMALKGSVAAPSRSIDVSALTGWLTLRAVENQAKRLRAIEGVSPQPGAQTATPKSEQAPALPAPVDIRPAPAPGRERQPPASVGPQN